MDALVLGFQQNVQLKHKFIEYFGVFFLWILAHSQFIRSRSSGVMAERSLAMAS
jgi:hypothetical protein